MRRTYVVDDHTIEIDSTDEKAYARFNGVELVKIDSDGILDEYELFEKVCVLVGDLFAKFLDQINEIDEEEDEDNEHE
jgi:hypothetical protein